MSGVIETIKIWNKETWNRIEKKTGSLAFFIPGSPVGQEHEENKKYGGRRTAERTRQYMNSCGWYARKAICDHGQQGKWPYEGDIWMDVELYYLRESPRPDPENVIASLQDGFTRILWMNDRNVLGRPNYHWWPGKNGDMIPPQFVEMGKYVGGVNIVITRI